VDRPRCFEHHRFVGDKRNRLVHDLDSTRDPCAVEELMASARFASFGPDTLAEARNRGYRPCPHCTAAA
jgi:hypothetical protein